jgi:putative ABC transport system permease protein
VIPAPPRLSAAILRVLLPAAIRDDALDELRDGYLLRLERSGRRAADRWYRQQVPAFAIRVRLATFTGGPLGPPPVRDPALTGSERMTTILADLRYGARAMARNPAFTAIAVLTLALGIGANAAIFSVVRTVLLRPLPFPEPDRLVQVWEARRDRGWTRSSFTHANFWDVNDLNTSFSAMGAITWGSISLAGKESPELLGVAYVTTGFLRALGVTPVAGRAFADGEDRAGADPRIVILSHRLWTTQFGADRSIVGRTITLSGQSYRVIGVLPPGTPWLDAGDLFMPLIRGPNEDRDSFELTAIARLGPGITIDRAKSDLERIAGQLASQYPEAKGMGVTIEPSDGWVASDSLRRALWVLMASVGFLLLIACVNLANMLLARSTGRIRERAMRAALGATRGRVIQTAIAESVLLGGVGAAMGLVMAFAVVRLLRAFDPGDIPRLADVTIDGPVLAATLGAALLTSIVTGLAPALRTPYHDIVAALREGERSVIGNRRTVGLRGALVSIEVALSLMLLIGAGLLIRSFGAILDVDRGFQTANRVLFSVTLPNAQTEADVQRISMLRSQLKSRIEALPQVTKVAAVSMGLLGGTGTGMGFAAQDKPAPATDAVPWAGWRMITRDYFKTLGVPIVAGRDFTDQDVLARPWRVIISRSVAQRLWPNESAIGRNIILWKGQSENVAEVIGVAGDMRDWDLADTPSLAVYMPFNGGGMNPAHFVVHTTSAPTAIVPMVRSILAELAPTSPVSNVRTLDDLVGESVAARRFTMLLLAALAGLALLLALGGVYGVLAYSVSRRRTEIGMRMALGASASTVMRLVISQGMRPVVIGLAAGVLGAVALSRYIASLLFGITRLDAPTYAAVAALLAAAAGLACYLPARDAMRVDVLTALREE